MASTEEVAPATAWDSLVRRSIKAWGAPSQDMMYMMPTEILHACTDLDDFLGRRTKNNPLMFWIFQKRKAFLTQRTMTKWSRDRLDDLVIFPALSGDVNRVEFFFVSHFWQETNDPDPGGEYLRLLQSDAKIQTSSYIWVDWTCIPQHPRTTTEETYFYRALQTMPGIIRNCGFMWRYPPFEARMWILYEIAEYALTCDGGLEYFEGFDDIKQYRKHIDEMLRVGVRPTLSTRGYKCRQDTDKEILTCWLELIVLLTKLQIDILCIRRVLDYLTWNIIAETISLVTPNCHIKCLPFQDLIVLNGESRVHTICQTGPRWEILYRQYV